MKKLDRGADSLDRGQKRVRGIADRQRLAIGLPLLARRDQQFDRKGSHARHPGRIQDRIGTPVAETTALGAAYLAGVQAGLCPPPSDNATHWRRRVRFESDMAPEEAARRHAAWKVAVGRVAG